MTVISDVVVDGARFDPIGRGGVDNRAVTIGAAQSSPQLDQLGTALAKAQAAIKGAVKDVANPFFKAHYADLSSVWEACRAALTENGLSVVQLPERGANGEVAVITMLLHASGQFITSRIASKPSKDDPQQVGSVVTYLRRYGLAAMVGVAPEDDDGEAAMGRGAGGNQQRPSGGNVQPITTSGNAGSGSITEPMVRNLLIVAKKMGHTEEGVNAYTQKQFNCKLAGLPAAKYADLLKRVGDKTPLE
jgi:hypothetical protein